MQNEAAATSHKGPVIWCILLDLRLSQHASLGWVSAHFTNGYGESFVPSLTNTDDGFYYATISAPNARVHLFLKM